MMATPGVWKQVRALGLLSILGTLLLYGCTMTSEQREPVQEEGVEAPAPAMPVKVSVNAVMVALVDHAGHELWDVERPGGAPKADGDWREVEHHAIQMAAAGPLIALGGTGPSDAVWAQSPDWQRYAQEMSDAGLAAVDAAQGKNFEALVQANTRLVESCESCHKMFKPELPTEGIAHPH